MKLPLRLAILFCLIILQSCSKDDPSGEEIEKADQTGIFIDSFVSGLSYFTETKSGFTDENGNFDFVEGETVTFLIGEIILGSGPATENMSPIDIATTEGANIYSAEVKNIAAFLQSLDSDNNPENGIQISQATVAAIRISSIDFTQPIEKILGEIIAEVNLANDSNLQVVYPEKAATHLATSLGMDYAAEDSPFLTFTPTIESWIERPFTSVYWIHETDQEGNLITSTLFEKFPNRILLKYLYLEHNSANMPIRYEIEVHKEDAIETTEIVEVLYTEEQFVSALLSRNTEGSMTKTLFSGLNDDYRVVEAVFFDEFGNFSHRKTYTFLESGNREQSSHYDSETGSNAADLKSISHFSYTDFGDFDTIGIRNYPEDHRAIKTYFYREDNSLELTITTYPDLLSHTRIEEMYFNEAEEQTRWKVTTGEYLVDFFFDVDEAGTKIVKSYFQGRLYEVITQQKDGSEIWKTIEVDGSYKLEYRDPAFNLIRTEYYDSDGNLLRTE